MYPTPLLDTKTIKSLKQHPEWILQGRDNLQYLKQQLEPFTKEYGIEVKSDDQAPLIAFIFHNYNPAQMMSIATFLSQKGFYVASVNPPACPIREPRFRLTAPRGLTREQIDSFVHYLRLGIEESKHMGKKVGNILKDLSPLLDFIGI